MPCDLCCSLFLVPGRHACAPGECGMGHLSAYKYVRQQFHLAFWLVSFWFLFFSGCYILSHSLGSLFTKIVRNLRKIRSDHAYKSYLKMTSFGLREIRWIWCYCVILTLSILIYIDSLSCSHEPFIGSYIQQLWECLCQLLGCRGAQYTVSATQEARSNAWWNVCLGEIFLKVLSCQ